MTLCGDVHAHLPAQSRQNGAHQEGQPELNGTFPVGITPDLEDHPKDNHDENKQNYDEGAYPLVLSV